MSQPSSEGVPIPRTADPKKMDPKELFDLLQTERRNSERALMDERQRARQQLEQLRNATSNHIRQLEDENKALLKSLTRMQNENERLSDEIVRLKMRLETGIKEEPAIMEQHVPSIPVHPRLAVQPDVIATGAQVPVVPRGPMLRGDPLPDRLPPRTQEPPGPTGPNGVS